MATPVSPEQLQAVVDYAQKVINAHNLEYKQNELIKVEMGKRYARLVKEGTQRFCYGFVDMTNGDLLKAASWKIPEKNFARGNVHTNDLKCCGPYRIV